MKYNELSDEQIERAWDLCNMVFEFMDKNEDVNEVKSLAFEYMVIRLNKARKDKSVDEEIKRMIGIKRSKNDS